MKGSEEGAMWKIGITCYPTLGGSGVVATELGKLLAERGHEIHFITHSMPFRLGQYRKNIFYHEVEVTDYHVFRYPPYDLALASKMASVAKMQKLDLLHVHYALPHAVCAYLAKQMVGDHLKIVTTLHGTDITILAQEQSVSDLIRLAINNSDAVTAVSNDLIRQTRKLLQITRDIELAYNFVDKRVYYPRRCKAMRREFARPDEKILMHISNFRPVKRVMDVVDIFRRVREQLPSKLMLVGEGPELARAQAAVAELRLEQDVHFLGKQDDVAQVISMADLFLMPSEKESFGLAALEAMACGVPVVGSTAGGLPELVVHGETGYLAPVGDTRAMAQYALSLLQDAGKYQAFSQACIRRAHTEFSSDAIVARYEEIYRKVIGDRSAGGTETGVMARCNR
jgi:N-acetyl-alpha-D-glucosaminyl L-malate synthase BshA